MLVFLRNNNNNKVIKFSVDNSEKLAKKLEKSFKFPKTCKKIKIYLKIML